MIRTELEKLRSVRTFWIATASALAITGITLATQMRNAGIGGTPSLQTAQGSVNVLAASGRASFVALIVGIVLVTSEFRHNTITTTFLVFPSRTKVVAAKLAAAAVFGLFLAVVTTLLCVGAGLATGATATAFDNPAVGRTVIGVVVGIPLFAVLGVGIGTLVPKQTVAVTGALLWFLVVETLLGSFGLQAVQPYTPVGVTAAVASDRSLPGALPPLAGGALLLAYGLAFAAAGAVLLRRRNIT